MPVLWIPKMNLYCNNVFNYFEEAAMMNWKELQELIAKTLEAIHTKGTRKDLSNWVSP